MSELSHPYLVFKDRGFIATYGKDYSFDAQTYTMKMRATLIELNTAFQKGQPLDYKVIITCEGPEKTQNLRM